jgi:hypothetical protein
MQEHHKQQQQRNLQQQVRIHALGMSSDLCSMVMLPAGRLTCRPQQ